MLDSAHYSIEQHRKHHEVKYSHLPYQRFLARAISV